MTSRQVVQSHGGWLWAGAPQGTGDKWASQAELDHARTVALERFAAVPLPTEAQILAAQEGIARMGASRWHNHTKGNNQDRRSRAQHIFDDFGDGTKAPCVYCGIYVTDKDHDPTHNADDDPWTYSELHQDHIIPASQGGRFILANLLPSCGGCNDARSDKPFAHIAVLWQPKGRRKK